MEPIAATLNPGDTGPHVANLQDALRLLLDRSVIRSLDPPNQPTAEELAKLEKGLAKERAQSVYGNATQRLVRYVQLQEGLGDNLGGAVEANTAARLNEILTGLGAFDATQGPVVRGTVRDANGNPMPGVVVRAIDRDLRHWELLGRPTVTKERGDYEISYAAEQFARAESGGPDIQIQAFDSDVLDKLLGESSVLFNAGSDVTVDLTLSTATERPSEFETYLAKIVPLLNGQADDGGNLGLTDLTPADIEFIVAETGIEKQHLEWLHVAHQTGEKLGSGLAPAASYGWFRKGLPTQWDALRVSPINMLRRVLLDAIVQNIVPASLRDQMEEILARIPNPQIKELASLPGVAALPADRVRALLSVADGVGTVSDEILAQLVEQNRLRADEANAVGLSVSLHRLAGGATKVISATLDSTFASLRGRKIERSRDLALLELADWESVLERSGTVTDTQARTSMARALAIDATKAFPHTAFVARAMHIPSGIAGRIEDIRPLLLRNKGAIASDFDSLDLSGLNEETRSRVQALHAELRSFANQHPGLGLHEALSISEGTIQVVEERIGWLGTVFELNPDVDFLSLDYFPDNPEFQQLKFGTLSEEARSLALRDLKAHRRMHAVTGNAIATREVMQAGFHSASVIARTSVSEFAEKTRLAQPEARAYHAKARDLGNEAAQHWIRIYEDARDRATAPIRSIPSASEFFQPLTGFQELINDQPWCQCAHCQSVLSPAAYFVDLMYYIEQHILRDSFKGKEGHSLHLKVRRPDLWELELTCKNTDEYVPYLDLVNDIIERYLKDVLPAADAADLYEFLARQEGSFKQPFTLPIDRLGTLLGHFELSRYTIAKAMGADSKVLVRARLNVSRKEYELITSEKTGIGDLTFFKQLFQITDTITVASSDTLFPPIEMRTLLRAMDLSHETVEAILKTKFVNRDGSTNPVIEVSLEKRRSEDVQNNVEWVKNLSLRRLDRIHRYTRLWGKLPWTIQELDHVVRRLTVLGLGTGIDSEALDGIVDLLELNAKWPLPIDELMALCDIFPDKGLRGDASLFDRIFNQPPFLARDGKWPPNPATVFTHPVWASNPQGYSAPDNNTLSRLLAGLQLADRELVELLESLTAVPDLGHRDATFDPVTNQQLTDESVSVWQPSLQVLYHHAQLMRLLGRTVTEFNKLLVLTPRIAARPAPERYIRDIKDVQSVVAFSEWQKGSGFTLDEILYVTRGAPMDGFRAPAELVGDIVEAVGKDKSLEFADTVFTELGLTDIQSRKVITDNLSEPGIDRAFESVAGGQRYRLKAGFDPAAGNLTVNDATIFPPVDVALFRSLLRKYYALEVLDLALGRALNLSLLETRGVRELARPLITAEVSAVVAALQGGNDRTILVSLVSATLPYRDPAALVADIVEAVGKDKSLEFAATVFTELGLTDIQSRTVVADNLSEPGIDRAFESVAGGQRYRLKAGFDPAAGNLTVNDTTISPPVEMALFQSLLSKYYALEVLDLVLGNALALSPLETRAVRELARPLIAAEVIDIAGALQGWKDHKTLVSLVTATLRYRALFKNPMFDLPGRRFVAANPTVFGLSSDPATRTITTDVVRNVASYVALAAPTDPDFTSAPAAVDRETLQAVLVDVAGAGDADIAEVLRTDRARIGGLKPHLALPSQPFDALEMLAKCLVLTELMGVSGETLGLMSKEESTATATYEKLSRSAEDVFAAFRAKYPDEETFQEKMEPYEDKLRTRKRDALVNFIVRKWPEPFSNPNKLYAYFLIDVLLEGCARTSKLVAAISSLQLYVQRVLMNLEKSNDLVLLGKTVLEGIYARFTYADKKAEWYWREHYRVWEANRKVFLYPENYIEPELRDNKTPLFEELESDLLQGEINDLNASDAYAKYLDGFDEVARLKIAGAYYDNSSEGNGRSRDVLHLFGVTTESPPVYYYRVINQTRTKTPRMSAWKKISLQIPVSKVAPIAVDGRLYVFWLETTTRPVTSFSGGTSNFTGYRHAMRVKYSMLRADGTWTPPQSLRFSKGAATEESRIVDDLKTADAAEESRKKRIQQLKDGMPGLDTAVTTAKDAVKTPFENWERAMKMLADVKHLVGHPGDWYVPWDAPFAIGKLGEVNLYITGNTFLVVGWPAFTADWFRRNPGFSALAAAGPPQLFIAQSEMAKDAMVIIEVGARTALEDAQKEVGRAMAALKTAQIELNNLNNAPPERVAVRWDRDKGTRDHTEPLDNYKPEGWMWDRVYPSVYNIPGSSAKGIRIVLAPKPSGDELINYLPHELDQPAGMLREGINDISSLRSVTRLININASIQAMMILEFEEGASLNFFYATFELNTPFKGAQLVANVPPDADIQVVNGETETIIIESGGDIVWLRKTESGIYRAARLGTTLSGDLMRQFAQRDDVSDLLNAGFQERLKESPTRIGAVTGQSEIAMPGYPFDPSNNPPNPCLTYLREVFFHIPLLVANHLNGEQKFAASQRWYHYIFNPTADGDPWRYLEMQYARPTSLRELLTKEDALAAYRAEPFNPHAIARTRLSAYKKAIVMKYIDNLLDWGDALFNQFTMESVNEATMLYVMAQEILGPRPAELGSCGEGKILPKTYNNIRKGLNKVSDFLIELEALSNPNFTYRSSLQEEQTIFLAQILSPTIAVSHYASTAADMQPTGLVAGSVGETDLDGTIETSEIGERGAGDIELVESGRSSTFGPESVESVQTTGNYWMNADGTPLSNLHLSTTDRVQDNLIKGTGVEVSRFPAPIDFVDQNDPLIGNTFGVSGGKKITSFDEVPPVEIKHGLPDVPPNILLGTFWQGILPIDIVPPDKNPVFCIPPNTDLIAYWNRVDDRLFKIRNCMDITGVSRRLELFAPEIDPRQLVRMKAAGLTLDDVLNSIAGNVPPYRFTYLIEKAKQFAGTLQNFGAQLLSALEKRDGEELSRLRAVHEQNLFTMRKRMTRLEIDAAQDTIAGLDQQKAAATYRQEHFRSLSAVGLVPAEQTQQARQKEASQFRTMASVAQYVAGILSIIPDVGAPTAMKFGGSQLGAAGRSVAEGLNAIAGFNEMAALAAGMEASNQRRDQEWKHQAETARLDILQINKQITAAKFRKEIAEEAQKVHEKTIDQTEEVFNFLRDKFSGYDRYTFLSKRLRELYRVAFKSALSMARMAEQAFSAERTDDDTRLSGSYWDAENLGLLAGERLLSDLQALEQQYIEKNYRQLEIEQSFSLAQIAPDLLVKLRLTSECEFAIPELFFDVTYPGHYRRRLKAVRLTIPCITGPYTNVGATLRLVDSSIRLKPSDAPKPVPLRHTVSIATSKGQYDSGVLDFNFRDERYMPFEGAGALSTWNLSLPGTIRVFDYNTISDVILHLSYTAEFDGTLRDRLESEQQTQMVRLIEVLRAKDRDPGVPAGDPDPEPPLTRVFSLRHDFPDAFHRLVSSPLNTDEITFSVEQRHFPFFLMGRPLKTTRATLRVISPLNTLATTAKPATFAIRQKVEPVPLRGFRDLNAPTQTVVGAGMKEFDLGNVLSKPGEKGGIDPVLVGEYLIVVKQAGLLALAQGQGTGAVDPEKLHDILIEVGYGLA